MVASRYTHRPWAGGSDVQTMHALLRARARRVGPPAYPLVSDFNYWLATTRNPRVPHAIEFWFCDDQPVGYVWPSLGEVDFILHPDHLAALPELFAFGEANAQAHPSPDRNVVRGWRFNDEPELETLLLAAGFHRTDDFLRISRYDLRKPLPAAPALPEGYSVRALAGPDEAAARQICHCAAFSDFPLTAEHHLRLMQSSLYRLDLDMVAVAPDGAIASTALFWYDPALRLGQIEPVGTHPDHERKGLATACMVEGMRRMWALGAEWATITSARADSPGSRLYDRMGFVEGRRHEVWVRPVCALADAPAAHNAPAPPGAQEPQ